MDQTTGAGELLVRSELVALAIVIGGLIAARLASMATGALLGVLDRRTARISTSDASLISPRVIKISRAFVFWVLVVLAVSQALRVLGVGGISTMLNTVLEFMPRLLTAFAIMLAGHLLGLAASHLCARLSDSLSPDDLGPRLAYGSLLTVAIVMGVQAVNVDISFVAQLLLILVGTASAGLMLAFGLGARQHVANLLARRELSRLSVGQRVRIETVAGSIVDVHDTGIDVATEEGVQSVPAARLAEIGFVRLAEGDDDV